MAAAIQRIFLFLLISGFAATVCIARPLFPEIGEWKNSIETAQQVNIDATAFLGGVQNRQLLDLQASDLITCSGFGFTDECANITTPFGPGSSNCGCRGYIGGTVNSPMVCTANVQCALCKTGCFSDYDCPANFICGKGCEGSWAVPGFRGTCVPNCGENQPASNSCGEGAFPPPPPPNTTAPTPPPSTPAPTTPPPTTPAPTTPPPTTPPPSTPAPTTPAPTTPTPTPTPTPKPAVTTCVNLGFGSNTECANIPTPFGPGSSNCACGHYIGGTVNSTSVCQANVQCSQCKTGCNSDADCPVNFNCAGGCGGAGPVPGFKGTCLPNCGANQPARNSCGAAPTPPPPPPPSTPPPTTPAPTTPSPTTPPPTTPAPTTPAPTTPTPTPTPTPKPAVTTCVNLGFGRNTECANIATPFGPGSANCACGYYIGGTVNSTTVCQANVQCSACRIGCYTDANCPPNYNCAGGCGGAPPPIRGFPGVCLPNCGLMQPGTC